VSFPILDAVAAVLSENPSLTKVAVQGHTDAREAKSARGVGLQRAEAAAAYLRAKGILGSRLVAVDAGAAHPVATNATRAGRAKNRRVEWVILTRSEPEPHK
jgi:outer membrane protein OmpA-like peptidoglycan-associated protein